MTKLMSPSVRASTMAVLLTLALASCSTNREVFDVATPTQVSVVSGELPAAPTTTAEQVEQQVEQPAVLPTLASSGTTTTAGRLVVAARAQVGVTTGYDPAYRRLAFPGGDVEQTTGVCTDVVIRALRKLDIDLQKNVNVDMRGSFSAYPKTWGLKAPDTNIDHRRVPNLETYFTRRGYSLPVTDNPSDYLPGDIVTMKLPLAHIGIVSDRKTDAGVPLIIHNVGSGTKEEDVLFAWTLVGHFRVVQ